MLPGLPHSCSSCYNQGNAGFQSTDIATTSISIYTKDTLEAVYTGGNWTTSQIQNMTTGDGSTTAMNNQMWSYWGDNTVPPLQT